MSTFIFVTQDDPNEWRYHEKASDPTIIRKLPCFNPGVTVLAKGLYRELSASPCSLAPCLPGGASGASVPGTIYEIDSA